MPAGATVEVKVFGEDVVRRRLLRFADRAEDASSAFRAIVRILEHATRQQFATRGAYGGSRWRDLAPATIARKRRLGLDPRILRATGRLFASFVGGTDHIEEVTADSLRWGSRVGYGKYHQSTRPRRVIPYRPPVRLPESDKRAIVRELQRALVERG